MSLTVSADGNGAYATIQEAMAASVAGDTVRVGAGTYREPVALKSGVALLGSGSEDTRLELDGEGTQVYASEVSDAEISGFSLAYTGTGSYHTVLVRGSRVRISDCRMTNPREVTVYVIEASQVTIEHCVVEHGAPGILLEGGSHGVIRDSRVRNSRTIGIVFLGGASGEVTGSEVMDHGTYGIVVSGAGPVRLAENVVTGNADAGILGMDEGELEIHRNTLVDNGSNGVRLVSGSTATVVDNTLVGHRGGGVSAEEFRNVAEIGYNDVWDNGTTEKDGGPGRNYAGVAAPPSDRSINPFFLNDAEGDYRLRSNSPLLNAASDGGPVGALGMAPVEEEAAIPPQIFLRAAPDTTRWDLLQGHGYLNVDLYVMAGTAGDFVPEEVVIGYFRADGSLLREDTIPSDQFHVTGPPIDGLWMVWDASLAEADEMDRAAVPAGGRAIFLHHSPAFPQADLPTRVEYVMRGQEGDRPVEAVVEVLPRIYEQDLDYLFPLRGGGWSVISGLPHDTHRRRQAAFRGREFARLVRRGISPGATGARASGRMAAPWRTTGGTARRSTHPRPARSSACGMTGRKRSTERRSPDLRPTKW